MVEVVRTRTGNSGNGTSRALSATRWGAAIGGGALAIYGITRRSPLGIALAATGSTIALLGSTQQPRSRGASTRTSVLINCSPEQVFQFWKDFANLPRFMNHLQTVTPLDDRRSRWIAVGPAGKLIRWDAEITSIRENEHIAWRSLPGSDVDVNGKVDFQLAPSGRGTLVTARVTFRSAALSTRALSRVFEKWTRFTLRQDIRRLEALIEAGEIPTTEGQSHGPRSVLTALARVADPSKPIPAESTAKDAFVARRSVA